MNAATEFDLGPLTWVKGEIDLALQRAEEALGCSMRRGRMVRRSSFAAPMCTRYMARCRSSGWTGSPR
jgi:hypothetical protein